MTDKEYAMLLKQAVVEAQTNGADSIPIANLIAALDAVITAPATDIGPAELERYKADLQIIVEQAKGAHSASLEMFKSVIMAGQSAIKTGLILHGGAAVALLAFIGKLTEAHREKVPEFATSLMVFVGGAMLFAIVSGLTYLSQWLYAGNKEWKVKAGFGFNITAIALGLASYGIFGWGMWMSYKAFIRL